MRSNTNIKLEIVHYLAWNRNCVFNPKTVVKDNFQQLWGNLQRE